MISIGDPFGEVSKQLRLLKHFTSWLWFVHLFYPQGRMISQCGQSLDLRSLGMWENQREAQALGWKQGQGTSRPSETAVVTGLREPLNRRVSPLVRPSVSLSVWE